MDYSNHSTELLDFDHSPHKVCMQVDRLETTTTRERIIDREN